MTALQLLKARSFGTTTYDRLSRIGRGSNTWERLADASYAPANSTAWQYLNKLLIAKQMRKKGLIRSTGRLL